eukprot:7384214-Prymnesium_polylepis.1
MASAKRARATQLIYERLLSETYRDTPDASKVTSSHSLKGCEIGTASMCGWRRLQEDRVSVHRTSSGAAIVGVYDGHGGAGVAEVCARHVPRTVAATLTSGQPTLSSPSHALTSAFLAVDAALASRRLANTASEGRRAASRSGPHSWIIGSAAAFGGVAVLAAASLLRGRPAGRTVSVMSAVAISTGLGVAALVRARARLQTETLEEAASAVDDPSDCGATAICAVVQPTIDCAGAAVAIANAGDCRAVASVGAAFPALAVTTDHKPTVPAEKRRILLADSPLGRVDRSGRINGDLDCSRSLGDLKYKASAELPAHEQVVTAVPDVHTLHLEAGGCLLLACDGVWDVLSNDEAIEFVRRQRAEAASAPTAAICASLLDACLSRGQRAKAGSDNM